MFKKCFLIVLMMTVLPFYTSQASVILGEMGDDGQIHPINYSTLESSVKTDLDALYAEIIRCEPAALTMHYPLMSEAERDEVDVALAEEFGLVKLAQRKVIEKSRGRYRALYVPSTILELGGMNVLALDHVELVKASTTPMMDQPMWYEELNWFEQLKTGILSALRRNPSQADETEEQYNRRHAKILQESFGPLNNLPEVINFYFATCHYLLTHKHDTLQALQGFSEEATSTLDQLVRDILPNQNMAGESTENTFYPLMLLADVPESLGRTLQLLQWAAKAEYIAAKERQLLLFRGTDPKFVSKTPFTLHRTLDFRHLTYSLKSLDHPEIKYLFWGDEERKQKEFAEKRDALLKTMFDPFIDGGYNLNFIYHSLSAAAKEALKREHGIVDMSDTTSTAAGSSFQSSFTSHSLSFSNTLLQGGLRNMYSAPFHYSRITLTPYCLSLPIEGMLQEGFQRSLFFVSPYSTIAGVLSHNEDIGHSRSIMTSDSKLDGFIPRNASEMGAVQEIMSLFKRPIEGLEAEVALARFIAEHAHFFPPAITEVRELIDSSLPFFADGSTVETLVGPDGQGLRDAQLRMADLLEEMIALLGAQS